jgi:endonuclease-3 related protein
MSSNKIIWLYSRLYSLHGPQGWWPIGGKYSPRDYGIPRNERERFEICAGAILTQNTSWKNVMKALAEMERQKILSPRKIISMPQKRLAKIIRSSGYHNQKARKLKVFSGFYIKLKGKTPSREELLSLWGIDRETADSMLLYAYRQPVFVIDAYTKRLLAREKLCTENASYDAMQRLFHKSLPKDFRLYNEFHALIVEHAKGMKRHDGKSKKNK